ncbi:sensor histidine kinase [Abyssisolibacter fermentans]|uniref:sensor histidine kinase n=1 Tax=Abyssisolibacter fermentans TaxID=1766203 RepID=UPI0009EC1028|nr:HAMP domain-containing sensor histidine kinase [Abyssisolibacter fermentans]
MIILNVLITENILKSDLEDRQIDLLTKANIVANRVRHYNTDDFNYYNSVILNYINKVSIDFNTRILITNEFGEVKADSFNKLTGIILNHDEVVKARNGENSTGIYRFQNVGNVMYNAVPMYYKDQIVGVVVLSSSIEDIFIKIDNLKKMLYLIYLVCVVITTIIGIVMSDYLLYPIKKFTKAINNMTKGKLGQIVTIDSNDEFKQLANAFNLISTQLSQVDIQRRDFVANVSHELKTPLCAIKLLSSSLLHENEKNVEIYKDFLKDIDSEVDRLTKIIDNLLALVDLDSEKLSLNYQVTYINYLLEKIIQRMKPLADEKDIDIKYIQIDKIQIDVDLDKIQQAIINIIHNAIKYTPNGGMIIVKLYIRDKNMVIEVKDNGIGIPKDDIEHIFERFYRVDKARTRNTGGTGLGLSIAYQIVTLHQGLIDIKSNVGKGTSFFIIIPMDGKSIYLDRR